MTEATPLRTRSREIASTRSTTVALSVDPQIVSRSLLVTIAALVLLSTLGQVAQRGLGAGTMFGFVRLFYVDAERNVPTFYSVLALLLASGLLALVGVVLRQRNDAFWRHWIFLAILFAGLATDEFIGFHEMPIERLRRLLDAHGLLYFTWVIPGAAFVALVAVVCARWLMALPGETRRRYLAAGGVFVFGAIGVEMLSGLVAEYRGEDTGVYAAVVTLEEACEMLGVWLFVDATLRLLQKLDASFTIRFGSVGTTLSQQIDAQARGAGGLTRADTAASAQLPESDAPTIRAVATMPDAADERCDAAVVDDLGALHTLLKGEDERPSAGIAFPADGHPQPPTGSR